LSTLSATRKRRHLLAALVTATSSMAGRTPKRGACTIRSHPLRIPMPPIPRRVRSILSGRPAKHLPPRRMVELHARTRIPALVKGLPTSSLRNRPPARHSSERIHRAIPRGRCTNVTWRKRHQRTITIPRLCLIDGLDIASIIPATEHCAGRRYLPFFHFPFWQPRLLLVQIFLLYSPYLCSLLLSLGGSLLYFGATALSLS